MRVLTPGVHRMLDYGTVLAFSLAPTLLNLVGPAAFFAYALAAVHLLMTLMTRFPGGSVGLVSLRLHGMVELVVGIAVVALPLVLGWSGSARSFFVAAGIVILGVWTLTAYEGDPEPRLT